MNHRNRWATGLVAGAVLGAAGAFAIGTTQTADAQGDFKVTPAQLQINQKISQAAVRRSNQGLNYLAPIRTSQSDAADDGRKGVTPLANVPGSGKGWTGSQIANEAINSEKIAPGGVTSGDLADNAVSGPKIDAAAVSSAKLADGAVTTAKIASGAVTDSKLASSVTNRLTRFALVTKTGDVTAAQSQGIAQANVTKGPTGIYCLSGLDPAPKNLAVTVNNQDRAQGQQAYVQLGAAGTGCAPGTQAAVITTVPATATTEAASDAGFYLQVL